MLPAGLAFSRWTTEATVMQEFKQYGHYMQPRIHKMVQEVCAHIAVHSVVGLFICFP